MILVLASSALVAPLAAAQADTGDEPLPWEDSDETANETANGTAANESANTSNAPAYSLETLRDGGRTVPGADPSTRWLESGGRVLVDYSHHNPLVSGETEDWEVEQILANGDLVRVNDLTLRASRMRDAPDADLELVVVYWSTETVKENNTTVTRPVIEAQERKDLSFNGAIDRQTVRLQRSDQERHVTMWLEDSSGDRVDGAAWTFRHDSVATSQLTDIETMGDYLIQAFWDFLGPIALGTFVAGVIVSIAVKRAGVGPQYGYGPWVFALSLGTLLFVLIQYGSIADVLANAPMIAAIYVVGIVAIVILESQQAHIKETVFFRPHLVDVANPRGDDALDSLLADAHSEKLVELKGGQQAVVRPGLLPFLSRVFGGMAKLESDRPFTTEINLVNSEWDQFVVVDPDADETLDYTPEGWTLEIPDLESWSDALEVVTLLMILAGVVGLVGMQVSWSWGIGVGLAIAIAKLATPTETSATVEPASGHERAAFISMMFMAIEHDDAETIESARKKLIQERAHKEQDVDDALEMQDATLIEEMHGSDVDRRLSAEPSSTSSRSSKPSTSDSSDDRDVDDILDEIPEVSSADD